MTDAETQKDEAERLRLQLNDLKAKRGMTQAEFSKRHKIPGGPSMLSQHLSGNRPINLEQVISYAAGFQKEGLECSVGAISPRLAKEINRAMALESTNSAAGMPPQIREPGKIMPLTELADKSPRRSWPFRMVTVDDVESLTSDQLHVIEVLIAELIDGGKPKQKHRRPAKKTGSA